MQNEICTLFTNYNETYSDKRVNWDHLMTLPNNPQSIEKEQSLCIASHTLSVKTKPEVLAFNRMSLCWADIDEGNFEINAVIDRLAILGIISYILYATSSSMRFHEDKDPTKSKLNGKRWRVLIQLKEPVNCELWSQLQEAIADLLKADHCSKNVYQILFLPNNPPLNEINTLDGSLAHYQFHVGHGSSMAIDALPPLIFEEWEKVKTKDIAINNFTPKKTRTALDGQISVIEAYNNQHSIEDELSNRGDEPNYSGTKWCYVDSTSGNAGISILNNKMYSNHTSDPMCDGFAHDSFDLMMDSNGLEFKEALIEASESCLVNPDDPNSQTIAEHNKQIYKASFRRGFSGELSSMAKDLEDYFKWLKLDNNDFMNWQNIGDTWQKSFQHKDKILAINSKGDLPQFTIADFDKFIKSEMFGDLINQGELQKIIEGSGIVVKPEEVKALMKSITFKVNLKFMKFLRIYRQRNKIHYSTDMFLKEPQLLIEPDQVKHISIHKPFLGGSINQNIIADFKQHFPYLDNFLELLVAARFAVDRKQAFFWLHACSNWGKKFLTDVFKDFHILVEMSVKEIEGAFEGKPIGRTAEDFKNCWILYIDEFKKVSSEIKQLTSQISGSPKNQMNFTAELYTKIFTSAESVDSLAGEAGVEAQFSNRFSLIPSLNEELDNRPLFQQSSALYFQSVKNYIAEVLNVRITWYQSLGEIGASNVALKYLSDNNKLYRLGNHYGELDNTIAEIAQNIKAELLGDNFIYSKQISLVTYHNRPAILVKNVGKIISKYIEENISSSEKVKVLHKKSQIRDLLDESDRVNKSTKVRVYHSGKNESLVESGIIIFTFT